MGRKTLCGNMSGRRTSFLKRGFKWATISIVSLSAVGIGLLPAIAAELSAWRYDSRSRSLTLTLPGSVTPNVSVIAPNQLLVELPDTQVGDVLGQRVNDGFVEQIALEQATPETVWLVVDFVPGTVLADTQQATPLAASSNTLQLWKVQPTLMASRRVVDAAVATQSGGTQSGAAALAVETPDVATAIAQADFPDLPVLEPAAPLSQPVSVPPIDDAPPVRVPDLSTPVVENPIQLNQAPIEVPVIVERDALEVAPPIAIEPVTPAEPPFIGGIDDIAVVEATPARLPTSVAVEPSAVVETARTSTEIVDSRANGGAVIDAAATDAAASLPAGRANTASPSRWPEPIPFGQPLP
ncbi:MAG: AMIN domain-containing protein [Phormidesmis sp.]